MNQDLRRRLIRPTILDPLLHRTVRLVVLHTGRGDCSPHKITHKMQKLKRRPLQTGLAPRRTHKISVPAMVQSKQRRPDPKAARTVLFLLVLLRPTPRRQPQGGITGTAWPARAHQRVRGAPLRGGGPLKGGRPALQAPPRQLHVADSRGLLAHPACQIQHHHHATKKSHRWGIALRLRGRYGVPILDYASSVCHDDSHCRLVADHGCQSGQIDSLLRTSELKAAVPKLFAALMVACGCCNRRQREVCDGDKDVELTRCLPLPSSTLHSVIHHDGSSAAQGTRHDTTRPSNASGNKIRTARVAASPVACVGRVASV